MTARARSIIETCREIAACTEEPGRITRTFLSPPMHDAHRILTDRMRRAGMRVWIDAAGNLRGIRTGLGPRLAIGSHLDTVPNAGAFDGILGVVIGIELVEATAGVPIEVIGFSEEEGVRFGIPFIGSRAIVGMLDEATLARGIGDAMRNYGLDPGEMGAARIECSSYLEFHIEQGPVLESLGLPLGVVEGILGQSRLQFNFKGQANHAGTTPGELRHDALAAAAEWIQFVECMGRTDNALRATVGSIHCEPNASNVIPGLVRASLDVRHALDDRRHRAVQILTKEAHEIGGRRGVAITVEHGLDQPATAMDRGLTEKLARAVAASGYSVHSMMSGAGHDAMILAPAIPSTMLFLRSPGGLSHHPDESVIPEDIDAAVEVGLRFIRDV